MARIPGAPSGNRYTAKDLASKKMRCGCYPGQVVTIPRGLPAGCNPSEITVVGEYDSIIVFRLAFDMPDDWRPGQSKTVTWNYSLTKASLLCGDAIIKDLAGRTLSPREEGDSRPGRRRGRQMDSDESELL